MEAKEVRSLQEAYASIYEEDERSPEANAAKQEAAKKAHQDKKKQTPITAGGGAPEEDGQVDRYRRMGIDRQQQREMRGQRERSQWKTKSESADLFDIVKGHLMSEGYADTEEAALAIMANMSEDWRNEIVEQSSARSREFEKRLPAERGSRGREFEHGSTRSAGTPSGNLADKHPRDPKTGKLMY